MPPGPRVNQDLLMEAGRVTGLRKEALIEGSLLTRPGEMLLDTCRWAGDSSRPRLFFTGWKTKVHHTSNSCPGFRRDEEDCLLCDEKTEPGTEGAISVLTGCPFSGTFREPGNRLLGLPKASWLYGRAQRVSESSTCLCEEGGPEQLRMIKRQDQHSRGEAGMHHGE